ncbi:MAG TPA: EAL domain-containing protein [Gammaproteobacteria bacterium]|nr:EAL domain-containing protein [Gammaproteobacteria bacterium]
MAAASRRRYRPGTICLVYGAVGLGWIVATDLVVKVLAQGSASVSLWEMGKGSLFVVATGALLYALLRRREQEVSATVDSLERLRQSYRSLFEHNPDAVYSLDLQGRYTEVNATTCELFGGTPRDYVGQHFSRFIEPGELEQAGAAFDTLRAGEGVTLELITRRLDGTPLECQVVAMPILVDGEVTGIHGITKDISARKQAERDLAHREELYRLLFDSNLYGFLLTRTDGAIRQANVAACRMLGYSEAELIEGGRALVRDPDDPEWERLLEHRRRTGHYEGVVRGIRKDGRRIIAEAATTLFTDSRGEVHTSFIFRDITEQRARESEYRLLARAMENAAEGMVILDRDWRITYVNDAVEGITGFPPEKLIGEVPADVIEDRNPRLYADILRALEHEGSWHGELQNRRRDGAAFPGLYSVSRVSDEQGRTSHYVVVFSDLSVFRHYEERVEFLSHHDPVTGLANAALVMRRGGEAIRDARGRRRGAAVMLLDLDRFKPVNESLGHAVGDSLLAAVGERLRECVTAPAVVGRRGGDEFALVLGNLADANDAGVVAERIGVEFQRPFRVDGHTLYTSASIGIACFPGDGADMQALLRNADSAMYRAKELGRKTWQFYSSDLNARARRALRLQNDLHEVLERDELELHFQPIVHLATGQITGAEALLRWRHPELGLVSPAEFIPLAEESGSIVAIGEWALERACRYARHVQDRGFASFRMSVNLSPVQFRRPDLARRVAASIERAGLPAGALELEITEGTAMEPGVDGPGILRELHEIGVRLALDDFGTGYSSLAYLKDMDLDYLKIDKTFTAGLPEDAGDVAITRTILGIAEQFRVNVIAEGIETEAQWRALQEWRCEEGQGYLFSRPVGPDAMMQRLLERRVLP